MKQPIKIWRFKDAPEQYRNETPTQLWNDVTWVAEVPRYLWIEKPILFDSWMDVHQGNGFSFNHGVAVEYDDDIVLIFGDG